MRDEELRCPERGASGGEIEIDLAELFYRLLESAWKIAAAAVAGALLLAAYSWGLATPEYEATCRVYVSNASDSAINLSDLQIGNYLTADYREVFDTWEVHEAVRERLGLDYSYERLRDMLEVRNPSDTRILDVTVTSADPEEAAALANAYAEVARGYISRTMDTGEPSILSSALPSDRPVRPRRALNVALGFALGGLCMAVAVTARFLADDKLKTAEELRRWADLATLAVVPVDSGARPAVEGRGGA